jgi:S-adenosylmethionine:tRNA ribosyltransferase-isomerase
MRLDAFDYHLPKSLLAQVPLEDRAASRLMLVDRETGAFEHATFRDLPSHLTSDDLLVVNRSRVIPARLFVRRPSGGRIELLVTRVVDEKRFLALANPMRRTKAGEPLAGEGGAFTCRVEARENEREVRVEITSHRNVHAVLEAYGHVPLPPYIERADKASDRERYQTVFASLSEKGSVAAPTAGLHFTESLLSALGAKGVDVRSVVLHVGPGTFLPLEEDVVEENKLPGERFSIDGETLAAVARARSSRRNVVAVGTTVARVLETASARGWLANIDPALQRGGDTDLFIYPEYEFRCVDRLITNFHLPKSSLLLLVCAFLGTEKTLACYEEAVRERYRFYSYGDAMLIR